MPTLNGSVGEAAGARGTNRRHDVAVVQALLRAATNPQTKRAYFGQNVTGISDHNTVAAIQAFQEAWGLAAAPVTAQKAAAVGAAKGTGPTTAAPAQPIGPPPPDKYGLIDVNSLTLRKLIAEAVQAKPDYARLRALPGTKYLYLEMTDAQLKTALDAVKASELEEKFKAAVTGLINKVYQTHKIALQGWTAAKSYRRMFKDQHAALKDGSSQAHPGEGMHQYGRAIDVGYTGLVMILEDGREWKITDEDNFDNLAKQLHDYNRQNALFKARNDAWEAPPQGQGTLFRIRLHHGHDDDPNHFQAYNQFTNLYPNDPVISMSRSLAEFLSKVSSSGTAKMK